MHVGIEHPLSLAWLACLLQRAPLVATLRYATNAIANHFVVSRSYESRVTSHDCEPRRVSVQRAVRRRRHSSLARDLIDRIGFLMLVTWERGRVHASIAL